MGTPNTGITFRFNRNDTVGTAQAELDNAYLSTCFVDTGDLQVLRDTQNPKRIIVGRTGAGKSALVRKLIQEEEHVVDIQPMNLSIEYIANSDVLQFFEALGVKLDLL
jgi:predicted GTPase